MEFIENRLYYANAYLKEFDAQVVEQVKLGDSWGVVLSQTAFYPTSGGQPHDTGFLNGVVVTDVLEREEDKAIVHVIERPLAGGAVHGQIDWDRRFDFMQQHTGQHILSHAFESLLDADTVGFHLTGDVLTIDINHVPLSPEEWHAVEDRANAIIFADLPVDVCFMDKEEVSKLPLRKPPTVTGPIRIVRVGELDYSPCGGTHCRSAGAVGLILIRKIERRGGDIRVDFVCGGRALADCRWRNQLVNELAAQFSVGEGELSEAVARVAEDAKSCHRQLKQAEDQLLDYEASEWLAKAVSIGEARLVRACFTDRSPAVVKLLALRLMAYPRCVALLGLVQGSSAQLTFGRSDDISIDMRPLLKDACRVIGGGGGGQANLAQGGGARVDQVDLALDAASRAVQSMLG